MTVEVCWDYKCLGGGVGKGTVDLRTVLVLARSFNARRRAVLHGRSLQYTRYVPRK